MDEDELHSLMNENLSIVDRLTRLIHRFQNISHPAAFFVISAQQDLMKAHVMLLGEKIIGRICLPENESDIKE